MNNARKPMIAVIALSAALAMPMAFAQEADWTQDAAAAPAAQPGQQLTWADLDADGDGNLSREEAAAHPALSAAFDQIDADGDGVITPQEYQAYEAAQQGAGAPPAGDDF